MAASYFAGYYIEKINTNRVAKQLGGIVSALDVINSSAINYISVHGRLVDISGDGIIISSGANTLPIKIIGETNIYLSEADARAKIKSSASQLKTDVGIDVYLGILSNGEMQAKTIIVNDLLFSK